MAASEDKDPAERPNRDQESIVQFLRWLPRKLAQDERQLYRTTSKGLFVDERGADRLVQNWQAFISEMGASSAGKAHEKHFRRLFGTDYPEEYYLLEGKICRAGYLIAAPVTTERIDLPRYQGSLLEAKHFLHHHDPVFAALPGLQVELALQGLLIRVKKGGSVLTVNQELLTQFQSLASRNPRFARRFPQITRSLRAGLPALLRCVQSAKAVKDRDPLLIPSDLRLKEAAQYLRFGPLVFAATGGIISRCYPIRGSGLMQFLEAEIKEIRGGTKRIGVLGLDTRDQDFIAHLMLRDHNERVLIHLKVLRDLYSAADPEIFAPKGSSKFTVFNCMLALSRLLESSDWINEQDVPQRIKDLDPKPASYRAVGNWIFLLKKNRAYGCAQKQPGLKEPLPPPRQRPPEARKESKPKGDKPRNNNRPVHKGQRRSEYRPDNADKPKRPPRRRGKRPKPPKQS